MQEHIRRAHPDHYIPKLPATEESFQAMVNTPPSSRPQPPPTSNPTNNSFMSSGGDSVPRNIGGLGSSPYSHDQRPPSFGSPVPARSLEDQFPAAATAAVALAQLHGAGKDSDWASEADNLSEHELPRPGTNSSYGLPPLRDHLQSESFNPFSSPRPRELLPSMMSRSPPGRSTTLPPIPRPRPRKLSVTQSARKARHERTKSKEHARRLSVEGRKAFSVEPVSQYKRWEDLIEAATSANEADSDRDLTPIPQSPPSTKRSSLPPFPFNISHSSEAYKASPLQRALTPPPADDMPDPFPSVESSLDSNTNSMQSGTNFHMRSTGLSNSDSSPMFSQPVQIYCANCRQLAVLKDSYACNGCISGFCANCVYLLNSEPRTDGRPCPRCRVIGVRYKPLNLDLR
ncbi:MAG: hypothetical protein LQ340_006665 [Diploschistes diacapsis]|nr:MAG: hypothetical protein LQ340_006665 [Diploschistes diacapsis]